MRPDEGGCADLRRSLAAHTKLVRSPTYAPARRPVHAPGCVGLAGAQGAFRPLSRRKGATRSAHRCAHRRVRRYRVCRRRAAPPRTLPVPVTAGRSRGPPTLAGTGSPTSPPPAVIAERHDQAIRRGGREGATGSTARPGACCREVKSRHWGAARANRPPLPLDATASPEFPGIRGKCERTARGPWNRAQRQHSSIGALSYDTYARAAALISRGVNASCGPACTRA